jgi:hypothetical protein
MGQDFAKDIHFMFPNHSFEEFKYLIVINTKTGERVKLTIEEDRAPCQVDWKEYLIQKGFDMMEKEIDKLCDECYKLR